MKLLKTIGISVGVLIGLGLVAWIGLYFYQQQQRSAFLKDMKGEIVFQRRDGQYYKIYKVSANGQNEKLVFAGDDKTNANATDPQWSDDGSRIYFTAMKDGKWSNCEINADGGDQKCSPSTDSKSSFLPVPEGVRLDKGSLYVKEADGRETLVYGFNSYLYDRVFSPGAQNVSWSPDKQYLVFESGSFGWQELMIADRNGKNVIKLADGTYADWK